MPRKTKPSRTLDIQSLSTGAPIRDADVPDDFGGEPIAMAEMYGPWLLPKDVNTLERERTQRKQAQAKAVLYKAGWYGVPKREHKPFKRRI